MSSEPPWSLTTTRTRPFDPPSDWADLPLRRLRYPDGHLGWAVSSHRLARRVLTDARFSSRSELTHTPVPRDGTGPFMGRPALPGWFVDMDPPEHTRLRRLLSGHFTMRRIEQLRPLVTRVVTDQLAVLRAHGSPADLVATFANPVPSLVICEVLAVPLDARLEFCRNSGVLFSLDATADEALTAMRNLHELMLGLVRQRRTAPGNDLLSQLTASDADDDELAGLGVLLLTGGHDSVAGMLGLGVMALLTHPEELDRLRAGEVSLTRTVEELLRYLTVFQYGLPRTALKDVELDGELIRAGECVTVLLSAANRDPHVFDRPDELDLGRTTAGHVALGAGIHQCVGQHLARLEMEISYHELFGQFPGLRLAVPASEVPMAVGSGRYAACELSVAW
ncbi:cytochrome P450 [Verrucosispora sp. WMMD573]|uniref:cytochrome P450 n=1 Tax=Verrucosispora sp. WMMD573 TaxID=3015149 RepID=UPI00248C1FD2|nr:cytochrome P450 [Verrucosispora sp. WMMD573]WBB53720.1 cytochrome P450 [Verrucosispora sp. WMMD573]